LTLRPGARTDSEPLLSSDLSKHWSLDPKITFLNHGSYGACPRPVLDAQQELRERIERQPVEFFSRALPSLLDAARERLATFLGTRPESLVPVPNATTGVNAVLRSLSFGPGDELLTTDHAYNACRNAVDYVAERSGADVKVVAVPFPADSSESVADLIVGGATPRTRLALIDHVTSSTGLVLPLGTIVRRLQAKGVDTLVDGAHAPGMLLLDLDQLGAAYYTGNCHKWLCAPKGAAFLFVREDRWSQIRPLTISHGTNRRRDGRSRLHDEFDWVGTDDPTAFLCVPAAIEFLGSLVDGGWPGLRRRNHALALRAREILAEELGVASPCPEEMVGSLAALPLPDGRTGVEIDNDPLHQTLIHEHRIEVPVLHWPAPPRRLIRVSAQVYNREEQYRLLATVLRTLLARE